MKDDWDEAVACAEQAEEELNNALSTLDDALLNLEECAAAAGEDYQDKDTEARIRHLAESLREAIQIASRVYAEVDQLPGMLQDKTDAAADEEEEDDTADAG